MLSTIAFKASILCTLKNLLVSAVRGKSAVAISSISLKIKNIIIIFYFNKELFIPFSM